MTDATQHLEDGKAKLAQGFRELIAGGEELLQAASSYSADGAEAAREKLAAQVSKLKTLAGSIEDSASDGYHQICDSTNSYVRENPWHAAGAAALVGLAVGALLAKR